MDCSPSRHSSGGGGAVVIGAHGCQPLLGSIHLATWCSLLPAKQGSQETATPGLPTVAQSQRVRRRPEITPRTFGARPALWRHPDPLDKRPHLAAYRILGARGSLAWPWRKRISFPYKNRVPLPSSDVGAAGQLILKGDLGGVCVCVRV